MENVLTFKFKYKTNGSIDQYKAQLVAKGFSETYARVAKSDDIHITLSIAVANNLEMNQFDIKTTFLHNHLDEEIYIQQPPGYEVPRNIYCKLQKNLYNFKQASQA
jgi:hypothetical protein